VGGLRDLLDVKNSSSCQLNGAALRNGRRDSANWSQLNLTFPRCAAGAPVRPRRLPNFAKHSRFVGREVQLYLTTKTAHGASSTKRSVVLTIICS
jgi:hypothetical protein